ncbi:HAMP domain-containing histidine kinase [bacterium]|jgi:signal transduction histidine kinase|nr:HAMP domain-containing histidine kinase [bacterium]
MENLATQILLWLAVVTGNTTIPSGESKWTVLEKWDLSLSQPVLRISANAADLNCQPGLVMQLPALLYGAQEVWINGKFDRVFGDKTMQTPNFIFNAPNIDCRELPTTGSIEIKMYSYSKTYASISYWPKVQPEGWEELLFKFAYAGGAFALLLITLSQYLSTFAKEDRKAAILASVSAVALSIYQCEAIFPLLGFDLPMLTVHRLGDLALSIGTLTYFASLRQLRYLPTPPFYFYLFSCFVGFVFNMNSSTGDGIQFGTTFWFPAALICFMSQLIVSGSLFAKEKSTADLLCFVSTGVLAVAMVTEMLVFAGAGSSFSLFPLGANTGFLIFGLLLNKKTQEAYKERDYLRKNLELEVKKKTLQLQSTQAELIQSAKLASLGTLSAGLAHEINNSINYVNGALSPLEKLVSKANFDETQKGKIDQLFKVMKDGLSLTVDIIKSLRQYTGLNQAPFNDIMIEELVKSTTTILRNKLRDKVTVQTDFTPDTHIFGSVVGMNQVFMNLVTNAIDAMPHGGTLTFRARPDGDFVKIEISDTGTGIPQTVRDRIFDPFFTTKEVGKGTGLGLHIVKKEIERHQGTVDIQSTEGKGTTIVLRLPIGSTEGKRAA